MSELSAEQADRDARWEALHALAARALSERDAALARAAALEDLLSDAIDAHTPDAVVVRWRALAGGRGAGE